MTNASIENLKAEYLKAEYLKNSWSVKNYKAFPDFMDRLEA